LAAGAGGAGGAAGAGGAGCAPVSALPNRRPPASSEGRIVVNNLLIADSSKQRAIRRERLADASPVGGQVNRPVGVRELDERAHVVVDVVGLVGIPGVPRIVGAGGRRGRLVRSRRLG